MFFKKEADERTVGTLNTAIIIVFIGILLTFSTILTFTSEYSMNKEEEYFDKESHEQIFLEDFSELFYKNSYFTRIIKRYEYDLFTTVSGDEVLYGEDGFLFQVKNKDTGYNFWLDCAGKLKLTQSDADYTATALSSLANKYSLQGIEYYTVLLPNTQTLYFDKLPFYIVRSTKDTQREALTKDLYRRQIESYIDTTEALIKEKTNYPLCNNTENSLTPLGAYFAYREICKELAKKFVELNIIDESTLHYQLHYTKGRDLAEKAAISDHAENLTVSLTDKMERHYMVDENARTKHTKNTLYPNAPKILVSVTHENDRAAFLYFFASTFGECVIESEEEITDDYVKSYAPDIYLRIIHEDEISKLIK